MSISIFKKKTRSVKEDNLWIIDTFILIKFVVNLYTVQIYNNFWRFLLVSLSLFIPNEFFQFSFRWQQTPLESQQWACDDAFESCKPHSAKDTCQYTGLVIFIDRNTVMLDSVRTSRNLWFRHRMLTHSLWFFNLIMMFFSCFPVGLIEVIICQYNLHKIWWHW